MFGGKWGDKRVMARSLRVLRPREVGLVSMATENHQNLEGERMT
jgi:hypothetical protein